MSWFGGVRRAVVGSVERHSTLFRPRRSLVLAAAALLTGCANPGPPRPPSLFLPAAATRVSVTRAGSTVTLRFAVPQRSTDGVPLKSATLSGSVCRQLPGQPCVPSPQPVSAALHAGDGGTATWQEQLPAPLTSGQPQPLAYRITFNNRAGQPGAPSDAVYTVAGPAPSPLQDFRLEGSRRGVLLSWAPTPAGDVLIRREEVTPKPGEKPARGSQDGPGVVWLHPDAASNRTTRLLDDTAAPGVAYRYIAVRSVDVQLGGRTLSLRSAETPSAPFTLRPIYPPLAPTGLTAAGFTAADHAFSIDLVWQPVRDANLAGYNVYRQSANAGAARQKLTPHPVAVPAFHDATAAPATEYRYFVTAIDPQGNESPAASFAFSPNP